jgi:hypothetical protein
MLAQSYGLVQNMYHSNTDAEHFDSYLESIYVKPHTSEVTAAFTSHKPFVFWGAFGKFNACARP